MTIPTRPAPSPPSSALKIDSKAGVSSANAQKEAPPRPPPPKIKADINKSTGILSKMFSNKNGIDKSRSSENRLPLKIPAPPSAAKKPEERSLVDCFNIDSTENALISFDEAPSQSSFMKLKTGSDSISIDSLNSATSSPSNFGATSQAERCEYFV